MNEFSWVAAGQIFSLLGGLIAIKFLTTLLTPEQYGVLGLALSIPIFAQQVWAGPFSQAVSRFIGPHREIGRLPDLTKTGGRIFVKLAACQSILLILGLVVYAGFSSVSSSLVLTFTVAIFLSAVEPAFSLAQIYQVQLRNRKSFAQYQILFSLCRPLLAALLVYLLSGNEMHAVAAYAFSTAIILALQARNVLKITGTSGSFENDIKKKLYAFAFPYLYWGVLSWATLSGDRWILQAFHSAEAVGLYVAAIQVGTILPRLGGNIINQFISPILNEKAGFSDKHERVNRAITLLWRTAALFLFFGIVLGILVFIFKNELVGLLTGNEFHGVSYLIPWLFLGSLINQMAQFAFAIGPLLFRPAQYIFPRSLAYLITIVLMIFLADRWGIEGMVAAFCSGAILHLLAVSITTATVYRGFIAIRS